MSSDLQREHDAARPEWYGLVLACLRGEIPIDQVPSARRWLCRQWRPPDRRRSSLIEGEDLPSNGGWTNIESGAHLIGGPRGIMAEPDPPGRTSGQRRTFSY